MNLTNQNTTYETAFDHITTLDYANNPHADSDRRAASKRYASAINHIDDLFSRHSRLMVVKVILWYEHPHVHIPRHEAMLDFDSLWHQIDRHSFLHDYEGYIWKMEYGEERGTHFHLVLFYNGAEHRSDGLFGREVKHLWEEVVATNAFNMNQGGYCHASRTGSGYVCNFDKGKYNYLGLGVIHREDFNGREGLIKIAKYLSKHDGLISQISKRGERNFGVGYRKCKG